MVNPFTEQVIATVPDCSAADAGEAVSAAREAFPGWSETPLDERLAYLRLTAEKLRSRGEELAQLITRELGSPLPESRRTQVGLAVTGFEGIAAAAASFEFEEAVGSSLVIREPAGVAACITPWNYPLHQITLKVASALAAGCTVVLKPSEITPLNAYLLAEIFEDINLPGGVFNMIMGRGVPAGETLVAHPEVDVVSFTGSTRAGVRIAELAASKVNRVSLELGGKSANILLDDADFRLAVPDALNRCFTNSGQSCSALTRLLVPESRLAEVEELAQAAMTFSLGDPMMEGTDLGPLVSGEQRARVRGHITQAMQAGALLLAGGPDAPPGLPTGFFVQPTVFSRVDMAMPLAREEVFGPVLAISTYRDDAEAVSLANMSEFGLSGGVWSADRDRALGVARRLRTGQVTVNGGAYNFQAPFGGYKKSGIGRESGRFGIEEFLETKSLQL